jgi:hypothetical protein
MQNIRNRLPAQLIFSSSSIDSNSLAFRRLNYSQNLFLVDSH